MNLSLLTLELGVIGLALALLLIDLWTPPALTGRLGLAAAIGLLLILALSWNMSGGPPVVGCGGMFAGWRCFSSASFWRWASWWC
jgi:hypothetical protein